MVPSMVLEDVFFIVESLVKNQCKGEPYNFLPFNPLPHFFSNYLIHFFHLRIGSKSVVLSILIGVGEALV